METKPNKVDMPKLQTCGFTQQDLAKISPKTHKKWDGDV
jgi:hypothetical protein